MMRRKEDKEIATIVLVLALLLVATLLAGCAPTQFVLGDVTSPPFGCIEARTRGHEC
jgi:Na+/H+-translocating membrane pyrophosphatase